MPEQIDTWDVRVMEEGRATAVGPMTHPYTVEMVRLAAYKRVGRERDKLSEGIEKAQAEIQERWEQARNAVASDAHSFGVRAGELAVCNLARDLLAALAEAEGGSDGG